MNKTKVMINEESYKGVQNTGKWPCGVCNMRECFFFWYQFSWVILDGLLNRLSLFLFITIES